MTGLLFCFYTELFLSSVFNFVNFWNSMSGISIVFEPADENFINDLGVFMNGNVQGYSFR